MEVLSSVWHAVLPAVGTQTHGHGRMVVVVDNTARVVALGSVCSAAPHARHAGALAKSQAKACPQRFVAIM